MTHLILLFPMPKAIACVLALAFLTGCAAPTPETADQDVAPAATEPISTVWVNETTVGNFSVRVEITVAEPGAMCYTNSTLGGTPTPHGVHHMLYVEEDGAFSGLLVGHDGRWDTYINPGDDEAPRQESGPVGGRMSFSDTLEGMSYAVTAYGFSGEAIPGEPILEVSCDQGFQSLRVLHSTSPGVITFTPAARTIVAGPAGLTWSREERFSLEGEEVHLHGVASRLYGPLTIQGPSQVQEVTLMGGSWLPHVEESGGDFRVESPGLVADASGLPPLLAIAYAGFVPMDVAAFETA